MKNSTLKQVFVFMAFIAIAASFSSCNRGYGCPNDIKVLKNAVELLK